MAIGLLVLSGFVQQAAAVAGGTDRIASGISTIDMTDMESHVVVDPTAVSFTTPFNNVTQGHTLNVTWGAIDPKYEPLTLTARLINRTDNEHANGFSITMAARLHNTSGWSWTNIPYPLLYMTTGLYALDIRPTFWNTTINPGTLNAPVLARSTYFSIQPGDDGDGNPANDGNTTDTTGPHPNGSAEDTGTSAASSSSSSSASSSSTTRRLALGLGLSIGLASVLGSILLLAMLWRRRRRRVREEAAAAAEKQRQRWRQQRHNLAMGARR